jgi:hypothetical protein
MSNNTVAIETVDSDTVETTLPGIVQFVEVSADDASKEADSKRPMTEVVVKAVTKSIKDSEESTYDAICGFAAMTAMLLSENQFAGVELGKVAKGKTLPSTVYQAMADVREKLAIEAIKAGRSPLCNAELGVMDVLKVRVDLANNRKLTAEQKRNIVDAQARKLWNATQFLNGRPIFEKINRKVVDSRYNGMTGKDPVKSFENLKTFGEYCVEYLWTHHRSEFVTDFATRRTKVTDENGVESEVLTEFTGADMNTIKALIGKHIGSKLSEIQTHRKLALKAIADAKPVDDRTDVQKLMETIEKLSLDDLTKLVSWAQNYHTGKITKAAKLDKLASAPVEDDLSDLDPEIMAQLEALKAA